MLCKWYCAVARLRGNFTPGLHSCRASFQAQEELRQLHEKYGGYDHEMTKETVARLSKIISEKDFEIESLKQKCQTLLDVLQQQEKTGKSHVTFNGLGKQPW